MKPIRPGDRGPAVEDIQRRLRSLGYDLGRAGIDGIFLGATAEAVATFQEQEGISEPGRVGEATWAALVDATFTLGDRMLYLRVPHFHGRDVSSLQHALNVLGFACGSVDGIFGSYTEQAVREFQRNAGLPADGIVGPGTVRAVDGLHHVWEGKAPQAHSAAQLKPARAAEALEGLALAVSGLDAAGSRVCERFVNLALATHPDSRVSIVDATAAAPADTRLVLRICGSGTMSALPGRPVVSARGEHLVSRLLTALTAVSGGSPEVVIELGEQVVGDEHEEQRAAVSLLDAVCVLFS